MKHLFKFQESKFHLNQNYSLVNAEADKLTSKLMPCTSLQPYSPSSKIMSRSIWFDQTRIGIFSVYLDSMRSFHILLNPRLEFSHIYIFEDLMFSILKYLKSNNNFPSDASFYFPFFNLSQGEASYSFSDEITPFILYV